MAKTHAVVGVGCLLLWATVTPAWAYTTKDMLLPQLQPKQKGVVYSIPSPDEYDACRVVKIPGAQPNVTRGFALLDPKGRPICRFLDTTGSNKIDFWSYFKDGVEVYREWDTRKRPAPQPTNFRWVNGGGMKWGVDLDGDGKIDGWKMISAEEVAEEAFHAVKDGDLHRLQALFINENEIQALRLPSELAEKIRSQIKGGAAKFQATREKLSALNDKAQFVRVESAPPQCKLAEESKAEMDLFMYPARAVLFKGSDQKHDWMQTGEMLKVGMTWRLLDAPGYQEPGVPAAEPGTRVDVAADKETQSLLQKLSDLDQQSNSPPAIPGPDAKMVTYNLGRAQLVEQIMARKPAGERETWFKQIFDNLSTAAQYSEPNDTRAMSRLTQLRDQVVKDQAGSNLAGYGTFRCLWAAYVPKIAAAPGPKATEIQQKWLEELSKFVQEYQKADDTGDALFHLGMGCEALGKDEEAKRWYQQLVNHFPEHALAAKAAGSKRRLDLVGTTMELSAPTMSGSAAFDITSLKGKVVAVYYWASNCSNCISDFARLKKLHADYNAKGLEIVLVNLDDTAEAATRYLQANPVPGTHLFQAAKEGGGFNSPLALQYGIQGLPTLFLVGRDGKVINRTLQMGDLEDAVKKGL